MSDRFLTYYAAFWLAVLGAVLGSFFDCLAWRRAHGESIWRGRSHCGSCGHVLTVRDLVPVFSYLFARGRCRYCRAKIPADALLAELAGMAAFALLTWKTGLVPELAMWLILAALLLLLSLIDFHERLLPDGLLAAAVANRLIFFLLSGNAAARLAPMLIGAFSVSLPMLLVSLIMDRVLGRESMGGGDIKLLFVLGLYLDWMQMILLLFTACILGIAAALVRSAGAHPQSGAASAVPAPDPLRAASPGGSSPHTDTAPYTQGNLSEQDKGGKDTPEASVAQPHESAQGIPFGPCLAAAGLFVCVWGQPLIDWYAGLLH